MNLIHRRSTSRARELRVNQTKAERIIWDKLKAKQMNGFKFRRQYPIGSYYVDFVCSELMLIIEIDGGQHNENDKDIIRTRYLNDQGYEVLRFWNNEVIGNTEGVLQSLSLTLSRRERELERSNHVPQ